MGLFDFGGSKKSKEPVIEIQITQANFLPVSFTFGTSQITLLDKYGNYSSAVQKIEGGPVSLDPADKNRVEIAKQSKEIENLTRENDLIKQ